MLGWHEVSGFTQTCCRKHHVLVLIYLFLSTLTQCPDLFLKISSGVTLRNVETYNRGSLYIRYFVTKPSPHTDSKMSSSILSHGEETHHRNTQYPQTEQSFSCSVSSLSVTSFPIFRWCCRDAVGIERQSDSLFCAGPFESTPPPYWSTLLQCVNQKKGAATGKLEQGICLFLLSNLVISVMVARTEAAQVNWTWGDGSGENRPHMTQVRQLIC